MFLKMNGFMSGDPVIVNASKIVRITPMKEHVGCVLTTQDCTKVMVGHTMDEVCEKLGYITDMTGQDREDEE